MSDSGKRPLGFVNRRGHSQRDISPSDLSELSIDDQPTATTALSVESQDQTSKKSSARIKPQRVRAKRGWRLSRRIIIIGIIALICIVSAPIIIGETLRAQYAASTDSARKDIKTIVNKDILPLQKKTTLQSSELSSAVAKIESIRDDMCPGALLDNIAMLYPRARTAHAECIAQRSRLSSLVTVERSVVSLLSYTEKLDAALARVTAPSTDTFAVIANQQTEWQAANDQIKQLSPPDELKTAHDRFVHAVASITDGWSKLNIANNEQNAGAFQAAEAQLSKGYDEVRASKELFTAVLTDKQAQVSRTVANLF